MSDNNMKLLKILETLKETDEENPITATQIIKRLEKEDIFAERKSVYRCIESLREYGMDINNHSNNKNSYYIGVREFEDWELKILIDAIGQCKFIEKNNCKNIQEKIKSMASINGKLLLKSATPIISDLKSNSVNIKYDINTILKAINKKRKIQFQYTYVDTDLKRKAKKDGKKYIMNPYFLVWKKEKYYLICSDGIHEGLALYRIDKIINLMILENEPINPIEEVIGGNADLKVKELIDKSIYQYTGEKIYLTIKCCKKMLDELFDSFGNELRIKNFDDENIEVTISVNEGAGLYYWILQHEDNMEVIEPKEIREKVKTKLENTLKLYEK